MVQNRFFFQLKKLAIFSSQIIVISSQNNVRKYLTKRTWTSFIRRKCTFAFVTGLIFGAGTFERKIYLSLNVFVLMTSFMSWSKSWNTSEKIIITKQTNKYCNNNHLCWLLVCQIQYNIVQQLYHLLVLIVKPKILRNIYFCPSA